MADFKTFTAPTGPGGKPKVSEKTSSGKFFVDYKRTEDLRRFMTPNGKIQSRKKTGLTAREQRMLSQAIKRARYMALLPYTSATV
jgi:small subunit ribosomal protein S18